MTVGILGTGLIGGSIGLRARASGRAVLGCDADPAAAGQALACGALDAVVEAEELYERCEVLVLAAYADATIEQLGALQALASLRADLTIDVASVKAPIVAAARGLRNFVATHPIAGAERRGPGAARADLFEGRTWAYVSSGAEALDRRAVAFVASMGALPLAVGAREHDAIVGLSSHLAQLLASAFAECCAPTRGEPFEALCGSLARELLRVGSSDGRLWESVLKANAGNVEPGLRALGERLLRAADALRRSDDQAIRQLFEPYDRGGPVSRLRSDRPRVV